MYHRNQSSNWSSRKRNEEKSHHGLSLKRTARWSPQNDAVSRHGSPPAKRSIMETSSSNRSSSSRPKIMKLRLKVVGIVKIPEKKIIQLMTEDCGSRRAPLIKAQISERRGSEVKNGDLLEAMVEIIKKDDRGFPLKVYLEKILKKTKSAEDPVTEKTATSKSSLLPIPTMLIHELHNSDISEALLNVQVLDRDILLYKGCSSCETFWPKESAKCKKCRDVTSRRINLYFSRMRVCDFSGQILVSFNNETTRDFLVVNDHPNPKELDNSAVECQKVNIWSFNFFASININVKKIEKEWRVNKVMRVDWEKYSSELEKKKTKTDCFSLL